MNEDVKHIPIIDCPICKSKDIPLSHEATMTKGKKTIEVWQCSNCGKIPNIANDIKVKRYISINELVAMGFSEAKPPVKEEQK